MDAMIPVTMPPGGRGDDDALRLRVRQVEDRIRELELQVHDLSSVCVAMKKALNDVGLVSETKLEKVEAELRHAVPRCSKCGKILQRGITKCMYCGSAPD